MAANLPLLFLEGLLAFISPCMLPMLPVYLMYLATESGEGKKASVINTLGFVCSFTIVFMALGATATTLGSMMSGNRVFLQRISGFIILLFGLYFLGFLKLKFLDEERRLDVKIKRRGFTGALIFGAVFSLGWTPCLGPFLGAALLLASNSATVTLGMFYLFVFSAGLGIPYVLAALFFTSIRGVFQLLRKHNRTIRIISGIVLIISGILLLTDSFAYYAALFDRY